MAAVPSLPLSVPGLLALGTDSLPCGHGVATARTDTSRTRAVVIGFGHERSAPFGVLFQVCFDYARIIPSACRRCTRSTRRRRAARWASRNTRGSISCRRLRAVGRSRSPAASRDNRRTRSAACRAIETAAHTRRTRPTRHLEGGRCDLPREVVLLRRSALSCPARVACSAEAAKVQSVSARRPGGRLVQRSKHGLLLMRPSWFARILESGRGSASRREGRCYPGLR